MINRQKGTYDVTPQNNQKWLFLEQTIKKVFSLYNYEYLRTPIFEATSLFKRENEASDMVKKETYDFIDKGDRPLTLRPEGTAGAIRAIIENKLYVDKLKNKFFYYGSCYRYERPQKGRFREFYQFGCEVLVNANPISDAELILLAKRIMDDLGIEVVIKINSLGGSDSKQKYTKALKTYFSKYEAELCSDCKERLNSNPLRILDCKVDNQKAFFKNPPKAIDYLNKDENTYLKQVKEILDCLGIENIIDYKIVRGLDYYSNLVFEIISKKTGMVLAGGGRYDNLIKELGGPEQGAIGFAFGAERVVEEMTIEPEKHYDAVILASPQNGLYATKVSELLRKNNFLIYSDLNDRNFAKKLKEALLFNPRYLIFIGETEEAKRMVTIKNTITKEQKEIALDNLVSIIKE